MHVVGLTGGIGSGKSSLAASLSALGVRVIDADVVARRCVDVGTPGLSAVVERFGRDVLLQDGSLDRSALAALVFADPHARRELEAIVHPCIRASIDADLEALRTSDDPPDVVVVEHPLLIETGGHPQVRTVVVVEAAEEQRIARLVSLRGMGEDEARGRIAAQASDAERRAAADHIVINDGDLAHLAAQAPILLASIRASDDAR